MLDQLTSRQQDTLRKMMYRGGQRAYKLAIFVSPDRHLWEQANGTANDLSAIHEELCGVTGYFTRQAGW